MEAETSFGEQNDAFSGGSDDERDKSYRQRETSRRKKDSRSRHPKQQKRDLYGKGSGAVYCFLLITLIVAAVSTTGLILSIISFVEGDSGELVEVRDNIPTPTYGEEEFVPGSYNPDEVWLIQVGYDGSTLEYLDPIIGQIKGYNIDVLNAVCHKANKNCRLVVDTYTRCWSSAYGGQALMDRWYHACTGWRITTEREYAVKFTDPFSQRTPGFFVTASGSSGFHWADLRGKIIGLLGGWFTNAICLNNQDGIQGLPLNNTISNDQTKVYPTTATLEAALVSGELRAI